jgi:catechol 2,3-dioxygenase-like lactoylglutathione lyase family enzyme
VLVVIWLILGNPVHRCSISLRERPENVDRAWTARASNRADEPERTRQPAAAPKYAALPRSGRRKSERALSSKPREAGRLRRNFNFFREDQTMNPEANVKQAIPFFCVTDIESSRRFYIDGLGFEMTRHWIHEGRLRWCWLERGGASLMLQEFWKDGPHAGVPAERLGAGVTICFICEDALALYREFTARGIAASRPFVGNAMWVTSLADPDGYRIDFESDTDAPEESEYVENADEQ